MILRFTPRCCSVVAVETSPNDRGVIDSGHRTPARRDMTVVAGIGGINVIGVFPGSCCSIVTTHTVSRNTAVVKINVRPTTGDMAIVAGVGTLDMVVALTLRCCSVMTT